MAERSVVIPKPVLDSVETLDELHDWALAKLPSAVLSERHESA